MYNSFVYHFHFFYRELAFQISEQFQVLGKPMGLKLAVVIGGRGKQIRLCSVVIVFFLGGGGIIIERKIHINIFIACRMPTPVARTPSREC